MQRFARVQSAFCFCIAYVLLALRFLRHGRLHSAHMERNRDALWGEDYLRNAPLLISTQMPVI